VIDPSTVQRRLPDVGRNARLIKTQYLANKMKKISFQWDKKYKH